VWLAALPAKSARILPARAGPATSSVAKDRRDPAHREWATAATGQSSLHSNKARARERTVSSSSAPRGQGGARNSKTRLPPQTPADLIESAKSSKSGSPNPRAGNRHPFDNRGTAHAVAMPKFRGCHPRRHAMWPPGSDGMHGLWSGQRADSTPRINKRHDLPNDSRPGNEASTS